MIRTMFATAVMTAALVSADIALAYDIDFRGTTRASPELKLDMLRTIQGYAKARHDCSFIFSVNMTVLGPGFQRNSPVYARGGHFERWDANLCGRREAFTVSMWARASGGSDYAILPAGYTRPLTAG